MRPYVIVSPGFASVCGGIKVLHLLCHTLNTMGIPAYITGPGASTQFPAYCNTRQVSSLTQAEREDIQHHGIVVHPDIVTGNPLCFNTVVRWNLGTFDTIPKYETVFLYLPDGNHTGVPQKNLLLWHIEDYFTPPVDIVRSGACHAIHKGGHLPRIPETEGGRSTEILNSTRERVAHIFKTHSLFYSYDDYSLLLVEARLCGCPVKLAGYTYHTAESFKKTTFSSYAVALPEEPVDLDKLNGEMPLFQETYQNNVAKSKMELDAFIDITQSTDMPYTHDPCFEQGSPPWLPRGLFKYREV